MKNNEKNVEEISTVSTGGLEGSTKDAWMNNREEIIHELILRDTIKESIQKIKNSSKTEENTLRTLIRKLIINEAKKDIKDNPHASTAINILEDLLKQILPVIEADYKTLTSNEIQRESFRSHIVNGVENLISSEDIISKVNEVVKVDVEKQEGAKVDPSKFIDINDEMPEDGEEVDPFAIQGKDETGRNLAQQSFEQIEKNIEEAYFILSDPNDKKVFEDYLITNLKLYFDRWEEELKTVVEEPTTQEYEDEKMKSEIDVDNQPV
jgi:hypothetical protein